MRRLVWIHLVVFVFILALGVPAHARSEGGSLEALDPDGKPLGGCPLERTQVEVEVSGFVARVRVTQVFHNPFPDPVEAVYTFPLSHRAAVDAMWMRTEGREIRAEIKRREEARRIYEAARDSGRLAGLLDEERPNIFTQSLANLMPDARVEIEIHYVETLSYEAGSFEFTFPTVVGPRFVPGDGRVPDASRITPPVTAPETRAGHDITIDLRVDAGVPIGRVESKLHAIDVERPSETRAHVRLRRASEIPNRDFVLRIEVAGEQVRSGVLTHRQEGDGFVTFLLLPPRRVAPAEVVPKELIFLIDRSGSQHGLPLAKAKETVLWILERLGPKDTFQVIDFGNDAHVLFDGPQPASASTKARARRYLEGLRANGGTWMAEAVRRAAAVPADGNRLRVVVFMTDGYVGNDLEVLSVVRELRGKSRWFPFGTGNSTNRFLLEGIAREGGGEVETVLLNSPGDEVAERFWQRISSPVMTDVSLEFRGLDVVDVFPHEPADVWADRPLVIHGRYREAGTGEVIVRGVRQGRSVEETLRVTLPERSSRHDAIASLWARGKIDELLRRDLSAWQMQSFPDGVKEEAIEVALAHRILTPFTSFVAVEDKVVNESGEVRTIEVPVEMPQGVTYEGVFGEAEQLGSVGFAAGRLHAVKRFSRPSPLSPALSRVADEPFSDADAREERVRRDDSQELSAEARRALAPSLLRLVETGLDATGRLDVRDGRVKVRLVLSGGEDERRGALEALEFEVLQLAEKFALGWVPIERLGELSELRFVERVEVPGRQEFNG